jgi:hypothetical protein
MMKVAPRVAVDQRPPVPECIQLGKLLLVERRRDRPGMFPPGPAASHRRCLRLENEHSERGAA